MEPASGRVVDDFAAVGDHIVAEGVTTHGQLAPHGRSNGGLLVAATVNQHPDLAAVSLPGVGVLDMLRFHLFTIDAPVLVRIETSTGHRAGKPVSAVVQEAADLLAFAAEHTGLR
jgi:prolyl oligopeptidase PreP (S9A serine peptidase family)